MVIQVQSKNKNKNKKLVCQVLDKQRLDNSMTRAKWIQRRLNIN